MKAREMKKKMLQDYDIAISHYRKTIHCNIKNMEIEQAKIRQLEVMLAKYFKIEENFDFGNIY